jgi:hypothetical protein
MEKVKVNKRTELIDSRGPRFSAVITTFVLAIALISHSIWIIGAQLIVFLIGTVKGPQFTPYAAIYKKLIKPRLAKEFETEDVRPPRFAQTVGLFFAAVAVLGLIFGLTEIFIVATSFALAAAFLNAVFNYCLGCELYLLLIRARR